MGLGAIARQWFCGQFILLDPCHSSREMRLVPNSMLLGLDEAECILLPQNSGTKNHMIIMRPFPFDRALFIQADFWGYDVRRLSRYAVKASLYSMTIAERS